MIDLPYARLVLGTSPEQDDLLESRINAVVMDFNKKTMTKWDRSLAEKKVFNLFTTLNHLYLARPNVAVIGIRVWNRAEAYDGSTLSLVDSSGNGEIIGVQASSTVFQLENENVWTNKFVQIEFDSGYSVCPFDDMTEAILYQVRFLEERYSGERLITDSIGFEGGSTRFIRNMPIYKDAIKKYKVRLP